MKQSQHNDNVSLRHCLSMADMLARPLHTGTRHTTYHHIIGATVVRTLELYSEYQFSDDTTVYKWLSVSWQVHLFGA